MAFNRYKYNNVIRNEKSVRIYDSARIPLLEKRADDIYIYSQYGDRLDLLAYEYYGDTTLWPTIAAANNIGHGSLLVTPGIQLRIPTNPQIFDDKLKDEIENK